MKSLINCLAIIVLLTLAACVGSHPKVTTVNLSESTIEKTNQGTKETFVQRTTQTTTQNRPAGASRGHTQPISGSTDLAGPAFKPTVDTITKDGKKITIKSATSTNKKPPTYTQTDSKPPVTDNKENADFDCTTSKVIINAQSSTFMNADYIAQGQYIYPGAIYEYDNFKGGNYKPLDGVRNPIRLTTDNPCVTGSTWNIVDSPETSSIRDAIASIYSRFDNRQVGTMNLRYQTYETSSTAEMSLRLSGGASYATFSLENEYKSTNGTTRHNITIDAIKPLYTISTSLPYNKSYYQSNVDTSKNPVVISSVTYGIRVLANFTLYTNNQSQLDKFRAKYTGIGTTAHLDLDYLTNEATTDQTINCYVVGGPGNSTVAFSKEELEKGIKELVSGVTYSSARPISFELRDLAGNIIETTSATDEITTQTCVPHVITPELDKVVLKIRTGDNDKDHDTHYAVYLRKGINGDITPTATDCSLKNNIDVRYKDNYVKVESMSIIPANITYNDFVKANGGSILLRFTHGNDTWNIANFSVVLIFKGRPSVTLNYAEGFDISDRDRERYFFFDKDFKAIQ